MSLRFGPIQIDRQADYFEFLDACPEKASDYSFLNLWSWADIYGLEWAWTPELVWIRQSRPVEKYWAPVGDWKSIDWAEILRLHFSGNVSFGRVPEALLELWRQITGIKRDTQPSRGHWDYLYSVTELVELKGNKYHKKKNLLNQFSKRYDYQYNPLTPDNIHQTIQMQENWCTWRDCASQAALDSENQAISSVLNNWQRFHRLMGGAIMVETDMAAYTVAERLSEDTLVIHFEKGDHDFKGIYQAINQIFLENAGQGFTMVNREQDLDSEGLRKAKLSYNPVGFLKKFDVELSVQQN
ncbi:MAG: phosphatidylglycerol lysyltransferase domain-containing protein [Desulfobacterales bacterium]|nr:phosphatidylglycerol lysyltransferase domain-containing protein [Desulfobacterales bacterium]MDX2510962.1 phosphatidylglycerol lysyltransferase domain-containing protein [Desulfobacterales bacterium]